MVIAWDWDDEEETAATRAATADALKALADIAMSSEASAVVRAEAQQNLGEWLVRLKARWADPATPQDEKRAIAAGLRDFLN